MKKLLFFVFTLTLAITTFANEKKPFFLPPKNWKLTNPKTYTKYIKVAFTKNEKKICRPSINLSSQKTNLSLDEYTNEAKKTHEMDPNTTYTIIGKIDLKGGKAKLTEITKNVHSTDFKIMQMIFIKDKKAYIMTASSKKEDLLNNSPTFISCFKSFELIDNLFSKVLDKEKKNILIQKYNSLIACSKNSNFKQSKKNLVSFEKYLDKNYPNEGKYFTMLLIKKALKEIKDQ